MNYLFEWMVLSYTFNPTLSNTTCRCGRFLDNLTITPTAVFVFHYTELQIILQLIIFQRSHSVVSYGLSGQLG